MIATFRPAIASDAATLTPIALLPTPPLALAIATTARTSGSFSKAAAPFSALAPAGVPPDRASQKILVANYTFPGRYRPGVPMCSPGACDLRAARTDRHAFACTHHLTPL
jgi:hypothetical protein